MFTGSVHVYRQIRKFKKKMVKAFLLIITQQIKLLHLLHHNSTEIGAFACTLGHPSHNGITNLETYV